MHGACAKRSISRCTGSASPASTRSACSVISSTSTPRAAPRIRTCCATARSSSACASTTWQGSVPRRSPPDTMRGCGPPEHRIELLKASDRSKDQSYFLHAVAPEALAHTLFPLGELRKHEVRARAHAAGLHVHDKPDSTGICFIGERPFQEFLSRYIETAPARSRMPRARSSASTAVSGSIPWASARGSRLGGRAGAAEAPWYVAAKAPERNALIVVQDHEHPLLMSDSFAVERMHWLCRCRGELGARMRREDALPASRSILPRADRARRPGARNARRARAGGHSRTVCGILFGRSSVSAAA